MYKLIMQILEKSKVENVPVDVARDMLAVDGDKDNLKKAWAILDRLYQPITKLRNDKNFAEISLIVKMAENGQYEEIEKYIETLKKNGIM